MFRSSSIFNTPLILNMNMNMICVVTFFLRTWEKFCYKESCEVGIRSIFNDMYVVILLVVSCERRLHDTSPYLGLGECIGE